MKKKMVKVSAEQVGIVINNAKKIIASLNTGDADKCVNLLTTQFHFGKRDAKKITNYIMPSVV